MVSLLQIIVSSTISLSEYLYSLVETVYLLFYIIWSLLSSVIYHLQSVFYNLSDIIHYVLGILVVIMTILLSLSIMFGPVIFNIMLCIDRHKKYKELRKQEKNKQKNCIDAYSRNVVNFPEDLVPNTHLQSVSDHNQLK